jgi:hypothetical protein
MGKRLQKNPQGEKSLKEVMGSDDQKSLKKKGD